MAESTRILEGIKVLDVASFIAAPAAATVMADFGADVIKIEPPGRGDTYRHRMIGPGYPESDVAHHWIIDNRNKRGIIVDLKTDEGRAVLLRLVAEADVFITNMPLPVRERLHIRWQDMHPVNERLIYGSVTAYGEEGAEADHTGFDSTALWARSGLMDLVKPAPDAPPGRSMPGMGDHPTAISLFAGIMAALYQRERTGKGTMVQTSLIANGVWWNALQVQAVLCGGVVPRRPPREEATNPLNNLYITRDGQWFQLVMITQEDRWADFTQCIGVPELADDPRFVDTASRVENAGALTELLDQAFLAADLAEWRERLSAGGFTFGVIRRVEDIPSDPQMRASGALTPIEDPRAGAELTVDSPLWIEGAEKVAPTLAPGHGEHTDEVLLEFGYAAEEIAKLRESGAVG